MGKAADIAKYIKDYFSKNKGGTRDISTQLQQLREALAKVHGNLKAMIQAIMQMSKDHLHKVYGNDKMKRDLDELEMMEMMVETLITEEFKVDENEAENLADNAFDEMLIEDEIEDEEEVTMLEKRDLKSVFEKMKSISEKLGDKFKQALEKVKSFDIDAIKTMLKNAGPKMLEGVKDLYEKIKTLIQNKEV